LVIVGALLGAIFVWQRWFVAKPVALPALTTQWHEQAYGLDEGEVIRFLPPPYSPLRMQLLRGRNVGLSPNVTGQMAFHANLGAGRQWGASYATGNVSGSIAWGTQLTRAEVDIPLELGRLAVDGDWYVRSEASVERRMRALESILSQVTGMDLMFEKRMVERDVLVAGGRWTYHRLEVTPAAAAAMGRLAPRNTAVQLFVDDSELLLGDMGGGSADFAGFLQQLEGNTGRRILDEVEGVRPKRIQFSTYMIQRRPDGPGLDQYLANVEKQTSLKFTKAKRAVGVWFVREKPATTQPGAQQ
jgi:hypothetical protein